MSLNIKHPETDKLVRDLASITGESITTAVGTAVRDRIERLRGSVPREERKAEILRIAEQASRLPILDRRDPDEILGYDESGLPR